MREHPHPDGHQPYTYLILFKPTCQLYYGVRFRKGCHPSELGVSYFSSSKVIHQLIEEYGLNQFEFQVRKLFQSAKLARKCEARVHKYFKVRKDQKWLNLHEAGELHFLRAHSDQTKALMREKAKSRNPDQYKKTAEKLRGKKKSPEHVEKIAAQKRGVKQSEHTIQQRTESIKGRKASEDQRKRMSESQKGMRMYANIETFQIKRFHDAPNQSSWFLWNNKWGLPREIRDKYPREMFTGKPAPSLGRKPRCYKKKDGPHGLIGKPKTKQHRENISKGKLNQKVDK